MGVTSRVVHETYLSQSDQIAGVVPFLTDPDPNVRKLVTKFLGVRNGRDGHADFGEYLPYMDSSELTLWMYKKDPAGALQTSMERAFRTNTPTTQEQRQAYNDMTTSFRWAVHIMDNALWDLGYGYITDSNGVTRMLTKKEKYRHKIMAPPGMSMVVDAAAMEQLDMLSQRPQWYARMYVASFIEQHPAFRTPPE